MANCRFSLFENSEFVRIAFAILFSGFALLTGHSSPYLRMSRWIFFLFIAVPWSFGISIAICLDPFGLPLKS